MKFVFPCESYKAQAIEFIQEFKDYSSDINGTGALDRYVENSTYEEWLYKVMCDIDIANVPADRVPALTYFYVRENDNKIIGMINIRLELNEFLAKEGGNIGYCIRPTERKKGYGTGMLREALEFLRRIGLNEIIITCAYENKGSAKICENNGGVLVNRWYSDIFKEDSLRYRIDNSE